MTDPALEHQASPQPEPILTRAEPRSTAASFAETVGDLQGILGPNLPQVEGLALPEAGTDDPPDTPRLESGDAAAAAGEAR